VINGAPEVSTEVRERVEAAVRDLGYVPNRAARALVGRPADAVAIVVCEPEDRAFYDPSIGEAVRGARQRLAEIGLQSVLLVEPTAAEQQRCVEFLAGGGLAGALVLSLHQTHPLPHLLSAAGVPTVLLGRPPDPATDLPYVDIDSRQSAQHAVWWLRRQGRTRIAVIAGPQDMPAARDRLAGYRAALGPDFHPALVALGDYTARGGRTAMAALLDRQPHLDAVFATSDQMALGALRALRDAGRRTPDDVAVVGFDDTQDQSGDRLPRLTTVHQPLVIMGGELVDLLFLRHETRPRRTQRVILPTHLVQRESA
jgi:DNA-binding LacI/PurR family transcriptional regulator